MNMLILSDGRMGHLNQLLALAHYLKASYGIVPVRFTCKVFKPCCIRLFIKGNIDLVIETTQGEWLNVSEFYNEDYFLHFLIKKVKHFTCTGMKDGK